jgi:hypothetical protein
MVLTTSIHFPISEWNCSRVLHHGDWPKGGRGSRVREKDAKDATLGD